MNLIRKSVLLERQLCECHRSVFSTSKRYIDDARSVSDEKDNTVEKDERCSQNEKEEPKSIDDITVPTSCCMSGCANCVWIEYAEKVSTFVEKSDVDMQTLIIDKIEDPNMKAFLLMELRYRNIIK